jgi:hypothetical protein
MIMISIQMMTIEFMSNIMYELDYIRTLNCIRCG